MIDFCKVCSDMDRLKALLLQIKELTLWGYDMFQGNNMTVYSGYATLRFPSCHNLLPKSILPI